MAKKKFIGRVAINICDLSEAFPLPDVASLLLSNFASKDSPIVQIDKSLLDTSSVVLDGPAAQDAKRVEAIVGLLQTSIGPRKMGRRVRCYREGPRGSWQEIRPEKGEHERLSDPSHERLVQ